MAAWELKVIFLDNESFELNKLDSPKIAEDRIKEILKNGHTDKTAYTTVYYPASSVLRTEIRHYPNMEPDKH